MGFFVNTLVLRLNLAENPTFTAVLEEARKVALDAYAHQDVPFEHLVEALQPPRNLAHAPLFQVMFALQNAPLPDLELPGLTLSLLELPSVTAKFDLTLEFTERDNGLAGRLEYNTDLFRRATMERLTGHLQTLLAGIVEKPEAPVHELPILTEAEQEQFREWNDTAVDYPDDKTIVDLFQEQVEKTPDAIAVVFEDRQLTYRELNRDANRLAHYLQGLGVGPEVLVGICVERSLEMVTGLLGILKAGGAYVPLDPGYPAERLAFMMEDSQVPVLLTTSNLKGNLPKTGARVIYLDEDAERLSDAHSDNLFSTVGPENLAYVIYTSGSTGKPKGTLIVHRGFGNYLYWALAYYQVAEGEGAPVYSPLGFDATITSLFLPLLAGGHILLLSKAHEAETVLGAMQAPRHWSLIKLTPAHLEILNTLLPKEALSGKTRFLVLGGDALFAPSLSLWREHAPGTRVINEYGPTETVVGCCIHEVDDGTPTQGPVPIGRPIDNTTLHILDALLQPLPIGIPGELHIGGAGLARGYLNRPELTAEKFIPNPFRDDTIGDAIGSRLYKTGDLCRYLPDGNIEYLGRLDNQVKIRGFRIELGEIEAALAGHPDVQDVAVVARKNESIKDELGHKRLVAFIASDLVPTRIPYETGCLLEYQGRSIPLQTVDICTAGVLLEGEAVFERGEPVRLQIRLPGEPEARWLQGRVSYSLRGTTGIDLKSTPGEQVLMNRSVDYELENKGFIRYLQHFLRDKLRLFLREKLPDYMIPSEFVLLISLPLTPNGKVDRRALAERPIKALQRPEKTFVAPRTAEEKWLADLWAKVLGTPQVGIHDDFFDLGGHSLLAVRLLSGIERQLGKQLPLSILFQGATIAELVLQLTGATASTQNTVEDAPSPWRPLVTIQSRGIKPPFFCLPGAGGNVLYLHELSRCLGADQPFYGLQAVGLDGTSEPDTRIEDMARRYIREIRTVRPQGPYLLGGHSFGGWVGLEMAKQLREQGEEVARLAIFDTTVPFGQPIGVDWEEADWIIDIAHIAGHLLGKVFSIPESELRQLNTEAQLEHLHALLEQNGWPISLKQLKALTRIFKANCQMAYTPKDIPPISISLFKARESAAVTRSGAEMSAFGESLKQDTTWGWGQYAKGAVDIQEVPGDHYTMMGGANVPVLAKKLGDCLGDCRA